MNISLVTAVAAYLLAAFPSTPPHPHHPKSIVIGGAAGKITVAYMTVPFNAEHLKGKEAGFEWHLGYAQLNTEVPLRIDEVDVPAGQYVLKARLGDAPGAWNFVLQDQKFSQQLQQARRRARNSDAARDAYEELQKKAKESELLLVAHDFKNEDDEHLTMVAINHGYNRESMRSMEPGGGVEFSLRVSFGDLHREVKIAEEFELGTVEASDKKKNEK